jgi:amino acid adenylation domain-containing protein
VFAGVKTIASLVRPFSGGVRFHPPSVDTIEPVAAPSLRTSVPPLTEPHQSTAAEIATRIAGLSPEKQALLARRFAQKAVQNGEAGAIEPLEGAGPAPLSLAQEMVWVYEQMTPGTSAYHIPMARRVRGPLEEAALERALAAVVMRHHALRTAFVELEGAPRQIVTDVPRVHVEWHDLRDAAAEGRDVEATRILHEATKRPFDLTAGTTPRVVVVKLADDDALLLIVVHHIAFDGGSISLFFRDLAEAYDLARRGGPAALPSLPIQFADFAAWSRRTFSAKQLAPALAYWGETLKDVPPGVALPTDQPRLPDGRAAAARNVVMLPSSTLQAVREMAAANGATTFMVLVAALQTLLYRYSGQDDVAIGTTLSGRTRSETQELIGFFANTVVLRTVFDGAMNFRDVLSHVRVRTLGAYEHQVLPYEQVVHELRAGRPAAEQALFNVMFTLQDGSGAMLRLGDATLEPVGVELGTAKFDLTISATELPDGLRIAVDYRSDLFERATITAFTNHLESLLLTATKAPDTPVQRLSFLTAADRRDLDAWNATAAAYTELVTGQTLTALLDRAATRHPDGIAVRMDDEAQHALTYGELHAQANRLAARLRELGIGVGDRVAVSVERSPELVVALVGILKAGAAYVPVDPEYPSARVAYMLGDADARVLLTHAATHAAIAPLAGATRVLSLDDAGTFSDTSMPAPVAITADAPAYMIYTSGSTGQPKGALNAHRGIVNRLVWMQSQYALRESDVVLQKTPFSFDVSVWEFFWPLMTGATLVMARPGGHRDPAYLADVIARFGVTTLHFVPSMLQAFIESVPENVLRGLHSLRDVMCSGEALPAEVVRRAYARLPQSTSIHNLYGPTECAVDVTHWTCKRDDARASIPIGHPVANTQCYVLDAFGDELPAGIAAELYLGGVQVGLGYHRRPELTAEKFIAHPRLGRLYRTGDIARRLRDGALDFLGRVDFQVKLRGFRVELGEIESALLAHPGIAASAVVMRADVPGLGGEMALVAYVVPLPGAAVDVSSVRTQLRTMLPEHMVPTAFVTLEELPLSPNGKLDRKALPRVTSVSSDATRPAVAPRSDLERVVASVWSEVLGREVGDVELSFFDLGGHSLIATKIVARLAKIFRTTLTLRAFFEAPTVAALASVLTQLESKPGQAAAIARLFLKAQQMSPEERERLRAGASREQANTA